MLLHTTVRFDAISCGAGHNSPAAGTCSARTTSPIVARSRSPSRRHPFESVKARTCRLIPSITHGNSAHHLSSPAPPAIGEPSVAVAIAHALSGERLRARMRTRGRSREQRSSADDRRPPYHLPRVCSPDRCVSHTAEDSTCVGLLSQLAAASARCVAVLTMPRMRMRWGHVARACKSHPHSKAQTQRRRDRASKATPSMPSSIGGGECRSSSHTAHRVISVETDGLTCQAPSLLSRSHGKPMYGLWKANGDHNTNEEASLFKYEVLSVSQACEPSDGKALHAAHRRRITRRHGFTRIPVEGEASNRKALRQALHEKKRRAYAVHTAIAPWDDERFVRQSLCHEKQAKMPSVNSARENRASTSTFRLREREGGRDCAHRVAVFQAGRRKQRGRGDNTSNSAGAHNPRKGGPSSHGALRRFRPGHRDTSMHTVSIHTPVSICTTTMQQAPKDALRSLTPRVKTRKGVTIDQRSANNRANKSWKYAPVKYLDPPNNKTTSRGQTFTSISVSAPTDASAPALGKPTPSPLCARMRARNAWPIVRQSQRHKLRSLDLSHGEA